VILIPDPEEMMFVTGDQERNLERIERAFDVKVVARGAELRISGDPGQVARVSDLVAAIRAIAEKAENLRAPALERLIDDAQQSEPATPDQLRQTIATTVRGRRLLPQSPTQGAYVDAMRKHDLVFSIGPAGTGKSLLAVAMAVNALRERKVARIILTRPAVEAGERLGFLPGELEQKMDPYLRPLYDALYELMPPERFARSQERAEIEIAPLAYMRGRTLNEAFIILDEAQNTTPQQMKMFLTRIGYGSKAVVTGDITQIDLPSGAPSGLILARQILKGVPGIAFVEFSHRDVVRHELVTRIVKAYDEYEKQQGEK
jgi:phosphate starvation-inducible PhoH-like protein